MDDTPPGRNGSSALGADRAGQGGAEAPAAAQVVADTPALRGKPGGPGIGTDSGAGEGPSPAGLTAWQRLQRRWDGAGIAWAGDAAQAEPPPEADRYLAAPAAAPAVAPVSAGPGTDPAAAPPGDDQASGWPDGQDWDGQDCGGEDWGGEDWDDAGAEDPPPPGADRYLAAPAAAPAVAPVSAGPGTDPAAAPPGDDQASGWPDGQDWDGQDCGGEDWHDAGAEDPPPPDAVRAQSLPPSVRDPGGRPGTAPPGPWRGAGRPAIRGRLAGRRVAVAAMAALVVFAAAVLTGALLPKHSQKTARPYPAPPGNQGGAAPAPLSALTYPGQQQRGVFQAIGRIVASGNTVVAIGSQAVGSVVRQQFFVSADGGASWQLAPVHDPGGGQPPVGYPAVRLAGGPGGWLAVGPRATWTSTDGLSWTLSATHGITPMLPGDQMWVLNSTSHGFLAAGVAAAGNGTTQGVIWTSRDGLTWRRETAAQLRLAGRGQAVQSIAYITTSGDNTVMSGRVVSGRRIYSAAWLSTDGGASWTSVTLPAGHGAGASIAGLGSDGSGLIAIRPGRSARGDGDGVAYFSPNGRAWKYAATIEAPGGWSPSLVKGSDDGFVVTGASAAGKILAYTSTGTGTSWRPTAPLGDAASEMVDGATVAPASTIIAIGSTAASQVSQQPLFLEATPGDTGVRQIPLAAIPGAVVPELAVSGLAIAGHQQVAVGSADGYPAVWRKADRGRWSLVTSLAQVSASQGLTSLTAVTHGPAGWLAVGAPGPVAFTSAGGTTWQPDGPVAGDLAGVSAVAAAAGPAGYIIAGNLAAPDGASAVGMWWSANLTSWTRAPDANALGGSNQVLAVAAGAHGFVSAGSHDGAPAVWTSANGRDWTAIVLPVPAGASGGVLQQVAIDGNHVAALGQETTAAGSVPFAEVSADDGASWTHVPFAAPGLAMTFTALTADARGFTAAAQFGSPGQQQAAIWTSAAGNTWTQVTANGLTVARPGGAYRIDALAPAGQAVTGIASITTQQSQRVLAVTLPAR